MPLVFLPGVGSRFVFLAKDVQGEVQVLAAQWPGIRRGQCAGSVEGTDLMDPLLGRKNCQFPVSCHFFTRLFLTKNASLAPIVNVPVFSNTDNFLT